MKSINNLLQALYITLFLCLNPLGLTASANLLEAYSNGEPPVIQGRVIVQGSETVLVGATIEIVEAASVQFTNELGLFSFPAPVDSSLTIRISYVGYATKEVQVTPSDMLNVEVSLEPTKVALPTVEVQAAPRHFFKALSQLDLQRQPIQNAQEALRVVPGLFIAQHAGGGKAEQLFLRGFDLDHGTDITIQVDGMPVNMVSHAHGQGYADLHFVIPELVDRVAFEKGTYNAALGNFATAGAVHFKTKNKLDQNFVRIEIGSFDTYRVASGVKLLQTANQHLFVAGEGLYSKGYFEAPQHLTRWNGLAKYTKDWSSKERFSVSLSSFTSEWDASGQIPQRAVDNGQISRFGAIDNTEGGTTSRTNVNFQYLKGFTSNTFLKHQLFYSKYDFELYSNFTFFDRDPINGDQIRQEERRHILGYNGALQYQYRLLGKPILTEFGIQSRTDWSNNNTLAYTKNRSETLERVRFGDVQEWNIAAYYRSSINWTSKFRTEWGIRFDQFFFAYQDQLQNSTASTSANQWSPKLQLSYQLLPNLQLIGNTGIGFHSNDTRVAIQELDRSALAAAFSTDIGFLYKPSPKVLLQAAIWQLDIEQELVYVGDEGIVEPSGRSRRQGIDLSLRYEANKLVEAYTDINWTRPRARNEVEGQNYIPLAPTFTSTGGIHLDLQNGWSGNVQYRWLRDRPANEDNSLVADGYFLLDTNIQYQQDRFSIGLFARNLLNAAWKEAQFETTSRLRQEPEAVTEVHFTPGEPFNLRGQFTYFF